MATPDHTALARPSNPFDGNFTSTPGRPPRSADAVELSQRAYHPDTAGIAVAVYAISCLLADSDAFHRAQANDLPTEPHRWPLTSVYAEGLAAAVHYLNQYAGTLGHEPRVNA